MEVNAFLLVLSSYLLLLPINLRLFLGFGTFLIVGYGVCTYHTRTTEEEASAEENRNFLEQFEAREKERIRAQQEREDAYVKLARHTIETYLRTGKRPSVPEGLPEELYRRQAGAFVSLKKDGRLRGCIGTIQAVQNFLFLILHEMPRICNHSLGNLHNLICLICQGFTVRNHNHAFTQLMGRAL